MTKPVQGFATAIALSIAILLTSSVALERAASTKICRADFKKISSALKTVVPQESTVMADETWWMSLRNENYQAWKQIRYYKNLRPEDSIEKILRDLKPDVLILDQGFSAFLGDTPFSMPFAESLRLSQTEFHEALDKLGSSSGKIKTICYGEVEVFKLDW